MNLISKIQQLTGLSSEAEDWLLNNIKQLTCKKNEIILHEGNICNNLYFVESGLLGGYYIFDNYEICNWISAESDFATSYYSFISRQPSYETIECFENSVIQAISYDCIMDLYKRFPETERAGRLILENYYLRLEERLISIQFKPVRERYDQLGKARPEILKRAPLGRIATYLGMKQETLSRIRAEK
jgi:CRP-like cAMP-binding protein